MCSGRAAPGPCGPPGEAPDGDRRAAERPARPAWEDGLRRTGVLTRFAPQAARGVVDDARVLAALALDGPTSTAAGRNLAALASAVTGKPPRPRRRPALTAVVLRGIAAARGLVLPDSLAHRRALWTSVGVSTDAVSGTVLTWALRPPGDDA